MKDETPPDSKPVVAGPGKDRRMMSARAIGHGGSSSNWRSGMFAGIRQLIATCVVSVFQVAAGLRVAGGSPISGARTDRTDDPGEIGRRLANAEAELAARSRSIALTSHDLRTPLNGILGMADLLGRTPLSPEQASYVQAVETSAKALLSMVDTILDAGRMAAGRKSPKLQTVAIETLVEEVIELLAPRAQSKGLELTAHVAAQVPVAVNADPEGLIRILMNLTGNAIKFTDRGGVAIEVSVERETEGSVTLALRVRDSGIGISREDQERIFGEYEQVSASRPIRSKGTGLGLAISRSIARGMGGDIVLESMMGQGSTFCFRVDLPIVRAPAFADRPFQHRRILLISDHIIEPPVLMRRLFDFGASVELARTAEAAHKILAADQRIDAILFDHSDRLDAVEFKAMIKTPHPPIAVMLAPTDRHALGRIRQGGIEAHLVKPMRTGSLRKVIAAMMSGKSIQRDPSIADAPTPPSTDQTEGSASLRILLADDNDINSLIGKSLLRSLGHSVEVVDNGALAVTLATEAFHLGQPYDVILMDLHMPVLDGFEAITAIRKAERTGSDQQFIIALTADITEQSSVRAIEAGADIAMTKPIDRQHLAESLDRLRSVRVAETENAGARQALPS